MTRGEGTLTRQGSAWRGESPAARLGPLRTDRACWLVVAAGMALAAAAILYLNRGSVFYVDELFFFTRSPSTDLETVFTPVNGHLIAVQRAYTKILLDVFGASYVPFRVLHVAVVLFAAGVFYAYAKRRIGALPALAPTLVLLFLGAAWQHVVIPIGTPVILSIALGVVALLALEREDRVGDTLACAAITLSLATFSVALAFLVGVAVAILTGPRPRSRAWVFLVPVALYGAWKLWSLGVDAGEQTRLVNVLLVPSWLIDSLALVAGSVTGLDYDFAGSGRPEPSIGWGRIVAAVAVGALVWRLTRGDIPRWLWVALAIALSYWAMSALAAGTMGRVPVLVKYVYPGVSVALLVAVTAAQGLRFTRVGLAALFGVAAVSLLTNGALLRDAGTYFRDLYSTGVKARLATLEITRDTVAPRFNPFATAENPALDATGTTAEAYLDAADRYGSLAMTPAELAGQGEGVRQAADRVLAAALGLELSAPADLRRAEGCRTLREDAGRPIVFQLPAGGAVLETGGEAPATVGLRRFADLPSVDLGSTAPGEASALSIPPDAAAEPWFASVSGAPSLRVCRLR